MAVLGTFSSFTTARLGIYASQASLNVTGNNIANINTNGYTRQRMDLVSLNSTGAAKYATSFMVNIGYGVLCESTSQLRDPYLDIRFRDAQSDVGFNEAKLEGLDGLAHFLDEVGKGEDDFGLIADNIHKFFDALEGLQQRVGTTQYDDLVNAAGDTLTTPFNTAAKSLETLKENEYNKLKGDVSEINNILTNIRDLNAQIRAQGIYGESALELRDARNVQLDKLSKFMKIDVTYSMEKIDQYSEVEKLTVTLADSGNPPITLVDGIYGAQFTMPEEVSMPNPAYDPSLSTSKQYIGKNGQPTDIAREAALMRNPDYDLTSDELKKYVDEKGVPTSSRNRAARNRNPNWDDNDDTTHWYLKEDGTQTTNREEAALLKNEAPNNKTANPVYYKADSIHGMEYIEKYETTADATDAEPMRNTDPATMAAQPYLKEDATTNPPTYVPTDVLADAAPMLNPDRTDKTNLYVKKGSIVATKDPGVAAKQLNPVYDPTLSSSNQFLRVKVQRDADGKAVLDADGKPIPELDANGKVQYEPTDNRFDPDDPDNPDNATSVPSFSEDLEANRYLFQLTALRDKDDHFMRDKYGVEIREEPIEIGDNTLYGSVQAIREMLTEEGEFSDAYDLALDAKASIKRGIPYYQKALDNWAQIFAKTFNDANQMDPAVVYKTVKDYPDLNKEMEDDGVTPRIDDCFLDAEGKHVAWEEELPDGTTKKHVVTSTKQKLDENGDPVMDANNKPVMVPKEISDYTAEELDALRESAVLREEYSFYNGGNLFSNSGDNNDATGITAKNISVSNAWSNGSVRVLATKQPNEYNSSTGEWIQHTTRQDNVLHMIGLIDEKRGFSTNVTVEDSLGGVYFKGSFEEMFTGISATLATDTRSTTDIYTDHCITSLDLDNSRLSVSGVDLNDEATSMMQYEKSYAAACRLLTTIDSMLDKLINGTAI